MDSRALEWVQRTTTINFVPSACVADRSKKKSLSQICIRLSRQIAGGNGEILVLRIGGEYVTAHRQIKTHIHTGALISAGEEKNIQHLSQRYFLSKRISQCWGPIAAFVCKRAGKRCMWLSACAGEEEKKQSRSWTCLDIAVSLYIYLRWFENPFSEMSEISQYLQIAPLFFKDLTHSESGVIAA